MYRILLVDDEILVRDAIKENIDWQSMDCELVGDCENGKQAAEFVQEHPVDIVLTDILMPYMDGMELSHFLHDNYPDIVIVVFSADTMSLSTPKRLSPSESANICSNR